MAALLLRCSALLCVASALAAPCHRGAVSVNLCVSACALQGPLSRTLERYASLTTDHSISARAIIAEPAQNSAPGCREERGESTVESALDVGATEVTSGLRHTHGPQKLPGADYCSYTSVIDRSPPHPALYCSTAARRGAVASRDLIPYTVTSTSL